jgi:hypothetical protein
MMLKWRVFGGKPGPSAMVLVFVWEDLLQRLTSKLEMDPKLISEFGPGGNTTPILYDLCSQVRL